MELLPSKYTMPKISSNNCINAAFEEIAEVLNNPKLREGFLNANKENEILNELVKKFDKRRNQSHDKSVQKRSHNSITHVCPKVNPNTKKIPFVPTQVNHDSIPETRKQDRPIFRRKSRTCAKLLLAKAKENQLR